MPHLPQSVPDTPVLSVPPRCPTYRSLPSYCRLEKEAGSCCARPVCEFDMQQGSFTGRGSVSGNGIGELGETETEGYCRVQVGG